MCDVHDYVFPGPQAVQLLTEAREDAKVCSKRTKYLEAQVCEYMKALMEKGMTKKEATDKVLEIHDKHLNNLSEDWYDWFIWSRGEEDENLYDLNGDKDEVPARLEDENFMWLTYHKEAHDIAYKAWKKTNGEPTEWGTKRFKEYVEVLDGIEQRFNPNASKPLAYNDYKMLTGRKNRNSFRNRLNRDRYKLYILTYEQWAYLTNWLNVLTNWTHLDGDNAGELKQYTCEMQNIVLDGDLEDVAYEVEQVFYTRD